MAYLWNPASLHAVFALPDAVADRATLRMAGAAQLKVLLWFARNGRFDPDACAADTAVTSADCIDAMRFWVESGVLSTADDAATAATPPAPVASPSPAVSPVTETPAAPASEHTVSAPSLPPLHRPDTPRPQFPDVVARQKSSPDFDYLLQTAEQRLGRPLTHGEMESFLYIYDTVGLPAEVILMILVDAIRRDKVRVKSGLKRYLEKVAMDWAERGIVTMAAAEREFCREERIGTVREHIRTLFSMDRTPTLLQVETAIRWIDEWGFSDEMLLAAFTRCREATGGFQSGYMNRILESWHADGITTPEQAQATAAKPKGRHARPLLSDETPAADTGDAYEQAAAAYRPVYRKTDE